MCNLHKAVFEIQYISCFLSPALSLSKSSIHLPPTLHLSIIVSLCHPLIHVPRIPSFLYPLCFPSLVHSLRSPLQRRTEDVSLARGTVNRLLKPWSHNKGLHVQTHMHMYITVCTPELLRTACGQTIKKKKTLELFDSDVLVYVNESAYSRTSVIYAASF